MPPLIIQPFVENAIWHGLSQKKGNKELHISIDKVSDFLTISIQDNGVGRKASQENVKTTDVKSRGIEITSKRLSKYNSKVENPIIIEDLEDENGKSLGTKVILNLVYKVIP